MLFWFRKLARHFLAFAATAIAGGLLTTALARHSPGFDADERLLDPRLDDASRAAILAGHDTGRDVFHFYFRHLGNTLRGDFGVSPSLNQPIRDLIAARLPVTLRLIGSGVAAAWILALAAAITCVLWRRPLFAKLADAAGACSLCLPSAVAAILVFSTGGPVEVVIPFVLFPRLFETIRNLLTDAYSRPHIVTARAKGVSPARILLCHALPVCAPELLALAGLSVLMAFGAAIPVETLCDVPGLGQLAWKAAVARDLPLLITLTLLIAVMTQLVNSVSDWLTSGLERTAA